MGARDSYQRIVIWLPNQGYVCDVGGAHVLQGATPNASHDLHHLATGTTRQRAGQHSFEARVIDRDQASFLRRMAKLDCKARLFAFGRDAHQFFYEQTRLQLLDARGGPIAFAGGELRLRNRIFEPAIWQGDNVLAGVPWRNTTATDDGSGTYYLEHPTLRGYEGPKWAAASTDSVNASGEATIAPPGLTLEIEFPCQGAVIKLVDCTGSVSADDWDGASLESAAADTELTIPEGTWQLTITVISASAQPRLEVVKPGAVVAPRQGGWDTNCATRVTLPPWAVPESPSASWFFFVNTATNDINRVAFDGTGTAEDVITPAAEPEEICIDAVNEKLYYTLNGAGQIRRCDFDGANDELVVSDSGIRGVFVQASEDLIVWTTGDNNVMAANLDGSGATVVYSSRSNPRGIVYNPDDGYLYWTLTGTGGIERGPLGGGTVDTLEGSGVDRYWIDVDRDNGKVYYADLTSVVRRDLAGTNPETVFSLPGGRLNGFRLFNGRIYYIDEWGDGSGAEGIRSRDLDGADEQVHWDLQAEGEGFPRGIATG